MRVRALITLVVAALAVWIFGPVLAGGQSLAFRDAGHYYHPLFNYIRNEWGAGRLPLWNPYENCGVPLLAENTASVFYPGKLLFALPLSFTWLYNLYIVLHVVLAVATSYLLARQLRARRAGALVGGISYAFSGNVLFQYCNVIFLVGAAWLPLALMYADRMLRERCWKSSIGFGVSLALMVLGGDPHMAYNAAIVAACYCVLLWWNDLRSPARCVRARLVSMFATLSCGLLLAALLAAIQILPTLEAAPFGERSHYDAPRSIYEYAQTKFSGDTHIEDTPWGLLGHSLHGHDQMLYYFSVEPWRLIELVWPNITGRPFATQRRWLHAFNAEQNIWTPSLYIGLLPVVLALSTWRLRGRSPVVIRGLSWLALLAALASLGWYGCGWCVQLILAADDARAGGQVGGVYWFMATVLPGYVQFRYPAKLWILAGLSLSMLAARGWRQLWRPRNRIVLYLAIVPFASLFVGLFSILVWPLVTGFLVPPPRQAWQGPFNWTGAWTDLADSLIHASLLSITLVVALRFFQCQPRYRRMLEWAMVAIVAIDLGAAQTHLVESVPAELWSLTPRALEEIPAGPQFRVYRDSDVMPPSFNERSSFARMAETIDWEHMTLRPKYPLPRHISMVESHQNVSSADYNILLKVGRQHTQRTTSESTPGAAILDLLGVRTVLVGKSDQDRFHAKMQIAEGMFLGDRPTALPRAWIVHQVVTVPRFDSRSLQAIERFTRELAFPDNTPRNWREVAVIETDEPLPIVPAGQRTSEEYCEIVEAGPQRVEIKAKLASAGLVVLADQLFPGWELEVVTNETVREVPILRTNRVFRGALLGAGEYRLIYRYKPRSFYLGAAITILTTISLFALSVGGVAWHRRNLPLRIISQIRR